MRCSGWVAVTSCAARSAVRPNASCSVGDRGRSEAPALATPMRSRCAFVCALRCTRLCRKSTVPM